MQIHFGERRGGEGGGGCGTQNGRGLNNIPCDLMNNKILLAKKWSKSSYANTLYLC